MPSSSGFLPKGDMPVGRPWDIYALVVMATGFGVVALVLLSSGGKLAVLEAWSCDDGLVARREEAPPSESLIRSTIKSAQSLLTSHAAKRADHPSPPRARGICPPHLTCQDVSGECGGRVRRQRGLLSESPRIRPLKITLGLQYGGGGVGPDHTLRFLCDINLPSHRFDLDIGSDRVRISKRLRQT